MIREERESYIVRVLEMLRKEKTGVCEPECPCW